MNKNEKDLSPRYYAAEAACWLLGCILVVSFVLGIAPDQPLPILNIQPANGVHYVRAVALLLIGTSMYLVVEWKQASLSARNAPWRLVRLTVTICWGIGTLWVSYPIISQGTQFAGISPAWYLAFAAIGFVLGSLVAILAFSALMIRSAEKSLRHRLPRVPAASRANFITWTPIILLLLLINYILLLRAPSQVGTLSGFIVAVPFLLMILKEFTSLCFTHDENGNRVPFAKRVARFREIHDFHDYAYFLSDNGGQGVRELGVDPTCTPLKMQTAIREHFANPMADEPIHFHVQQEEETKILFYPKDGNPVNTEPSNRGVRMTKRGIQGILRVKLILDDTANETKRMVIPVALVESHAEEYLSTHTDEKDLTFHKIFSYAINQTVIKVMTDQAVRFLHDASFAGQAETFRQLILDNDVDINERGAFGWTALLAASAQGYSEIVKQLLEAGANPDIGNVQGITPLMYGSRYGNAEICSLLMEYGAAIDVQDMYGMTALIIAAGEGHPDIVDLLIYAGADTTVKTRKGMTALDFAYACKHGKIAKKLKQATMSVQAAK